ncbi:MAG: tetraacyldisaccharide 4'-kinase [Thermoanaerobaculia bacterium]
MLAVNRPAPVRPAVRLVLAAAGGGRLAPAGRLREPLAAAARADAVVMSGDAGAGSGQELATALRAFGFGGPGFSAPVRAETPRRVPQGDPVALDRRRVLLVSAVARPRSFTDTARGLGAEIAGELRFPDHHHYPAASLDKISLALRDHDAELVLVTSKDRVKLQGRLELPLVELPIRSEPETGFFEWLEKKLAADRSSLEEVPK